MKKTKFVSVIFPTLNRGEILVNSIKDVLKQKYPYFEIIVIDQTDHQKPDVLKFLKTNKKIKYFHLQRKDSSNARNVGAGHAKGEILIFLDDDIKVKNSDFIEHHVKNFKDDIGMTAGRVVEIDRKNEEARPKEVGKTKLFGLVIVTNFDSIKRQEIDHAPGGNMAVLKKIYTELGGYKPIYRGNAHMEETDLSLRIKRAGYKIIFEPKAEVLHLQAKSGGNSSKNLYDFRYWFTHNYGIFILKYYGRAVFLLLFIRQFFWAVLSGLKNRDYKMFQAMWSGTIDGYRDYYKKYA